MAVHFVCIWHLVGLDHEAVCRDRLGVGQSFFIFCLCPQTGSLGAQLSSTWSIAVRALLRFVTVRALLRFVTVSGRERGQRERKKEIL